MSEPPFPGTIYPTLEDVLIIYAWVVEIDADVALDCVRDWAFLESALLRPEQAAHYAGADLVDQAATLLWGMVRNHPFQDGNKRVAYAVTLTFLRVNGLTIVATESEEFTLLIDIAQHLTVEQVSEWMRERRADYNPPGRGK